MASPGAAAGGVVLGPERQGGFVDLDQPPCSCLEQNKNILLRQPFQRNIWGDRIVMHKRLAQIAYVGPDAFMQGYNLARRLIDKYGIKAGDHGLIPVCCPDQLHIDARMRGVAKAFEEAGLTFDTLTTGLIIDETQSILAGYLLAHPETAVIASTGTQGTVAQAIEEAGLERIPNGDIDVNPRVMQNIKDGLTEATSDQQPFWQGFLPVVYIAYNVRYGLIPGDMDTSAGLVDQSNAIFAESYAGTYR